MTTYNDGKSINGLINGLIYVQETRNKPVHSMVFFSFRSHLDELHHIICWFSRPNLIWCILCRGTLELLNIFIFKSTVLFKSNLLEAALSLFAIIYFSEGCSFATLDVKVL